MTKRNTHDRGIETRIKQIMNEERYRILAIATNVDYINPHDTKSTGLCGEIDILKLYFNGRIGIEEVKSTKNGYEKAREQLQRAGNMFKYYHPELVTYIVSENKVIKYDR